MKIFKSLIPHPILTSFMVLLWISLVGTDSTGQLLLGVTLALSISHTTRRFWPEKLALSSPITALFFILRVIFDIIIANIDVARRVMGPLNKLRPSFIEIPLDIEDPFVATIFGSIVSLTPGTVTCDIDFKDRKLTVHALHVEELDVLIEHIKTHYETPLRKMFKC
jgi:multicomponent K+:H+ antiporter subunit E